MSSILTRCFLFRTFEIRVFQLDQTAFQNSGHRQDAQNKLRSTDLLVMRSQLIPDASPFLGLALSAEKLPQTLEALQTLSDWRLEKLLKEFGYAASWAICSTLSEHYGEEGNAKVWPLVEGLLGRDLKIQEDRVAIFKAFIRTCRKLA